MVKANNGIWLLAVIFLVIVGFSDCLQRTLDYAFNEGCPEICKNTNVKLGHVRANGLNDTLHYIWDFTENPTIFIAVTSTTAKLQINWKNYIAKVPLSVNFTEKPIYTFGVAIERILEFNDIHDRARIDEVDDKNISELKLKNFQWDYKNLSMYDNSVQFYTEAKNYNDPENNESRTGSIAFLMNGFGTLNHSHITPHMLHSENATQIDMVINHLETKKGFSCSRFAIELLFVSENYVNTTLSPNLKRKLDDEFTPGIFEVLELTLSKEYKKLAYLEWRPISYTTSKRDITESTNMMLYHVKNATVDNYFSKNNLLYKYYGENMFNNLVQRMNISIGEREDGFYKETKYATWTFIVGYGSPPDERFSNIIITILTIGVGLPLLILIISGIYFCVRRMSRKTENELLQR